MMALVDMRPTADTKPMSYDTQASQRPTLARAGMENPEKESMSNTEPAPLTDAEIRDSRRITVGGTDLYNIWRALDLLDSLLDKPEVQKQVEHIGHYRDATAALACLHSLVASFRSAVSPENERPSHLHPADHMRQAEKHLAMALEHIRETEYKDAPSTQRLETMLDHIGDSIHALEMKHGGQANA